MCDRELYEWKKVDENWASPLHLKSADEQTNRWPDKQIVMDRMVWLADHCCICKLHFHSTAKDPAERIIIGIGVLLTMSEVVGYNEQWGCRLQWIVRCRLPVLHSHGYTWARADGPKPDPCKTLSSYNRLQGAGHSLLQWLKPTLGTF